MGICSWAFVAFAALVVPGWHLLPGRSAREIFLLLANLVFFASLATSLQAVLPMVLFLVGGYAAVRLRGSGSGTARPGVIAAALVILPVGAFCWLKRYWFLAPVGFLEKPYVTVGLSYILFRVLHLVIDAKDRADIAKIGPLAYVNYTLGFTTLTAGPIHRFDDYATPPAPVNAETVRDSLARIAIGYFKLVIVAPAFIGLHEAALGAIGDAWLANVLAAAVCVIAWPVFLYFNFSGYVDIVIGIARLMGVVLPENFNRPFEALNFIDFWARYHMTLSSWLRDYVYTPLLKAMMMRLPPTTPDVLLGVIAYFVTFFLIGVWHGPTTMFALYGLLLAVGVSVNKMYQVAMIDRLGRAKYRELGGRASYRACARGLTFTWYVVSMVCFWSGANQATRLLGTLGVAGTLACIATIFIAAMLLLGCIEWVRERLTGLGTPRVRTAGALVAVLICLAVSLLSDSAAPDVVYKAF
jgi:alginate O-acetyltransferase complex protein AlgI